MAQELYYDVCADSGYGRYNRWAAYCRRPMLKQGTVFFVLVASMLLLLVIQYSITVVLIQRKNDVELMRTMYSNISLLPGQESSKLSGGYRTYYGEETSAGGKPRANLWKIIFDRKHDDVTSSNELCPETPPNLVGPVEVTYEHYSWRELERRHPEVHRGGFWRPSNCSSRHHVAIILPYRDRESHLRIFLHHMHPFLQRQLVNYGIYVVEQDPYSPFNRGMLFNIGFKEAMKDANYQCVIFHDVDLLPENDYNLYYCPDLPRHMSPCIDEYAYKLQYPTLFGGVEAFKTEHFNLINGFSNIFFGWGGEDDDLYDRITWHNLNLTRYPMNIARYSMVRHLKNDPSPNRLKNLFRNSRRFDIDGLNSLQYTKKRFERRKLFTWIYAQLNQTDIVEAVKPKLKEARNVNTVVL